MPKQDGSARWGEVVKASNDKGPYKLIRVQSDGHELTAIVLESYGVQGSPLNKGQCLLLPIDGDEGKMVAIVMPPPSKRTDQQKEGEVTYINHDTGNSIKHDVDGNTTIELPGGTVVKHWKDGTIGVKPGGGQKVALGDVRPDGMARVMTEAGPSVNVYAKI